MKVVFRHATVAYNNTIATIAYGIKDHGYLGIEICPSFGAAPAKSGSIRRKLQKLIQDADLSVAIANRSGIMKTTTQLGNDIITALT